MNVTGPFAMASGLNFRQIVGEANNTPGILKIDQTTLLIAVWLSIHIVR